ncbi:ROK family protein [Actinomyces urogenitalis]|uniref:ROK family protein n=1 Tax=Actinomyces urogenitalis TaxID=103621 RepID=UPI0024313167|nr:ROK family protein [Actinomyces urogenitalis]MCI7457373.1 ROK family protein [Actinomyces urogenitalis]
MRRETAVSADARRANAAIVYDHLLRHSPCSRKDLREATGLVSGTVTAIVSDLTARGLVRETGEVLATGGRPQRLMEVVSARVLGAVVMVTTSSVEAALVDLAGQERWSAVVPHKGVVQGAPALLSVLERVLREAASRAEQEPGAWYAGAVVTVPGLVTDGRTMVTTLEMPMRDVAVVEELERALGPGHQVRLLNSGRTAALAEWARLSPQERPQSMAYISLHGRGVSGGLVQDGRLVAGEHGLAGEVGHIVVESDGAACECGARGCLATVATLETLTRAAGADPELNEEQWAAWLCQRAQAGDEQVRRALERAARGVAAAVATLSNLTDVGLVVLGGQAQALAAWLMPPVQEMLASRARVNPVFNPRVVVGQDLGGALREGMVQELGRGVRTDPLAVPELG